MEKRLILAFALSFLVLIVWSYLYVPKQGQMVSSKEGIHEKEKGSISESTKGQVTTPLVPTVSEEGEGIKAIPPIKEKEILIETPLYSAVFSNEGATIKSFKLKKYRVTKDPDSPSIELINLENNDKDSFSIRFDNKSTPEDKKVFYSASEKSIALADGSAPKDLTFKSLRFDGVEIDQTYRFYPDRYDIDVFITIVNSSEFQSEGNISAYLKNLPPQKKKNYYSFSGAALLLDDKLNEIKPKKMV